MSHGSLKGALCTKLHKIFLTETNCPQTITQFQTGLLCLYLETPSSNKHGCWNLVLFWGWPANINGYLWICVLPMKKIRLDAGVTLYHSSYNLIRQNAAS